MREQGEYWVQALINGVGKFRRDVFPAHEDLFCELASTQSPRWLFVTCADSRIDPCLLTQTKPGELFLCRNAGNIIPAYGEAVGGVSATIEYAVMVLGVSHIIVCGHSDCGAMKGVLYPERVTHLKTVAAWLRYGDSARQVVEENYRHLAGDDLLRVVTEQNVIAQLDNLRTHPCVAARVRQGRLDLHGWYYDIPNGDVVSYNAAQNRFSALATNPDMEGLVAAA